MPCNSRQGERLMPNSGGHPDTGNVVLSCFVLLGIIVVLGAIGGGIYAAIVLTRQNNEQATASAKATAFAPYAIEHSALDPTMATLSGDAAVTYKPGGTTSGEQGVTLNTGAITFHNVLVPNTGYYNLIIYGDWSYIGYAPNGGNTAVDLIVNGMKQTTLSPDTFIEQQNIPLNQGNNTIEFVVDNPAAGPCYMWVTDIQISL
jgi:hypothetical protein